MNKVRGKIEYFILRISGLVVILVLWQIAPSIGWVDAQFVPTFSSTLSALVKLWTVDNLYMHIMSSLFRVLGGLAISAIIAIPSGFIMIRWCEGFYDAIEPLFRIFTKVNPFSLMPVFILIFGIGERIRVAVVVWVCIWPILFGTVTGMRSLDRDLLRTAMSMRTSEAGYVLKVLLPGSMHSIFAGIRIGVEMSFFILIAGEMLGANSGLGVIIHNSNHYFNMPRLYAGALVVVLLGVFLNSFLKYMQNGLFFWKEPVRIFSKTSDLKPHAKIGKAETAIITVILISILILGYQQIKKAEIIAENPTKSLTQDVGY